MPPLNALETWSRRSESILRQPKAKCFVLTEGKNTEFWYFDSLATSLARKGLPRNLEIRPVRRTAEDESQSNPVRLEAYANQIIEGGIEGALGFDDECDLIVVVFDTDIYKEDEEAYLELLESFPDRVLTAVTTPSFELFLLLHHDRAFEDFIDPHSDEILANKKSSAKRRIVEKLASDAFGKNPKSNPGIGQLADRFEIAEANEGNLNQDPKRAIGKLTSNVALTIRSIIDS